MDWVRSGRNPRRLYEGSTEEIVAELRAWVQRRRANDDTKMAVSLNMSQNLEFLERLVDRSERPKLEEPKLETLDQISTVMATQLENLDRTRVRYLLIVQRFNHYLKPSLEP